MMRLLVSVRDASEAMDAAGAGADFIDLKDPAAGALGGLPPARIVQIVGVLRARHPALPVSATIGDLDYGCPIDAVLRRVAAVAACGVDYVKVGVGPGAAGGALIAALAHCNAAVVPVLLADRGVNEALVQAASNTGRFPALMLDTADKSAGSLLDRLPLALLAGFITTVRGAGALAGLAGALRVDELQVLARLAPDFAGFRSAVCAGSRSEVLRAERVLALRRAVSLATADPSGADATPDLCDAA